MGDKESKLAAEREKQRKNVPGAGKKRKLPCENGRHREAEFPCAKQHCQNTLCANCAPPATNKEIICSLCQLSANNLDMDFDEDELNGFSAGGMIKQSAGVKIDKASGQVSGWDSIWGILELEDKAKMDQSDAMGIIDGYKKKKAAGNGEEPKDAPQVAPGADVDSRLADLSGYKVIEEDSTHFLLKHNDADREEFKLEMVENGGKVELKGLPEIMKKYLLGFDQSEIKKYPTTVLNVIIK